MHQPKNLIINCRIEVKMKNQSFFSFVLACLVSAPFLTGCNDQDAAFTVRREIIDVGQAAVGDSVKAQFTFRNNQKESIALSFIPECDCTTVNTDVLKLQPRECGKLEVKVAVENPGEFTKYVYVQAAGSEDFMAVAVKGHTK